jgi:hypothetical protein
VAHDSARWQSCPGRSPRAMGPFLSDASRVSEIFGDCLIQFSRMRALYTDDDLLTFLFRRGATKLVLLDQARF